MSAGGGGAEAGGSGDTDVYAVWSGVEGEGWRRVTFGDGKGREGGEGNEGRGRGGIGRLAWRSWGWADWAGGVGVGRE